MPINLISATNPVTVPATASIVYDHWYLSQLIVKSDANKAFTIVHLTRSGTDANGNVVLMTGPGSEISFTLDIFQQESAFPALGTAMAGVLEAVQAYASAKHLL